MYRAVPSASLLKPYKPGNWSDSISPAGDLGWVGSMDRQFVSRCNIRRPLWVPVAPFQCRPYIKRAAAISLMSSPRVLATAVQCNSGKWHTAWPCVPCDACSKGSLCVLTASISTLCSLWDICVIAEVHIRFHARPREISSGYSVTSSLVRVWWV
jgi:hypothetical protein